MHSHVGMRTATVAVMERYQVSICCRVFDSIETLNSHKRMDHSKEGYKPPTGIG